MRAGSLKAGFRRLVGAPSGGINEEGNIVIGGAAVVAAAGIAVAMRGGLWTGRGRTGPRANAPQAVPVEVQAVAKKTVPVRIEALGTVTPIASVAIKPRVDTEITGVHFRDGAMVKKGDLLFTLDSRDHRSAGQADRRPARRRKGEPRAGRTRRHALHRACGQERHDHGDAAKCADAGQHLARGSVDSNTAQLENLSDPDRLLHHPCADRRTCQHGSRQGGKLRAAGRFDPARHHHPDCAGLRHLRACRRCYLPDLRQALANESATIEAIIPGDPRRAAGQVTMIENSVDAPTGTVPVRATMPNTDELLVAGHAGHCAS